MYSIRLDFCLFITFAGRNTENRHSTVCYHAWTQQTTRRQLARNNANIPPLLLPPLLHTYGSWCHPRLPTKLSLSYCLPAADIITGGHLSYYHLPYCLPGGGWYHLVWVHQDLTLTPGIALYTTRPRITPPGDKFSGPKNSSTRGCHLRYGTTV